MKKVIIAHRMHHAEYYIRNLSGDNPDNFIIVISDSAKLNGLERGTYVTVVIDRGYEPTPLEMQYKAHILNVCIARSFKINRVWI